MPVACVIRPRAGCRTGRANQARAAPWPALSPAVCVCWHPPPSAERRPARSAPGNSGQTGLHHAIATTLRCALLLLINNLFPLCREHVTATEYRATRTRAFELWAEVSGVAAA